MNENPYESPHELASRKESSVPAPRLTLWAYFEAAVAFLVMLLVGAVAGNVVATAIWPNWPFAESPLAERAAAANPTWWVKPALAVTGFVAAFALLGAIRARTLLRRRRG